MAESMIRSDLSEGAWEAEFRKSGKDRQFNSYIAFRRMSVALAGFRRTVMEPRNLSPMLFIMGLACLFLPSFFYGDWNGMAAILLLGIAFVVSAVFVARMAGR